jgi:phosphate transport system substrate-binding protein
MKLARIVTTFAAAVLVICAGCGNRKKADTAYPRPHPSTEHARPAKLDAPADQVDHQLAAYRPVSGLEGKLVGGCSTTMPDVMRRWIAGFTEYYPKVSIQFKAEGGKVAAWDLAAGAIDFAGITREIDPYGLAKFVGKFGYDPLEVPVAGGSYNYKAFTDTFVFFVNKDNPLEHLSFKQLDGIYSESRKRGFPKPITTWGQVGLGGKWTQAPIHPWGVKPWNGYERFARLLVLDGGTWRKGLQLKKKVIPLAGIVANDPLAIGYASLAWLNDDVKPVAVSVSDDGPFIEPTFQNVLSRKYPLSRLIYIYVNRPPGKPLSPLMREFLRFIVSNDGQQEVVKDGIYLPLTPGAAANARARIDQD